MSSLYSIMFACGFNALDILSGLLVAWKNKKIVSSKLRDGMFKKVGFIFCYLLGWVIDNYGDHFGFKLGVPILGVIIIYAVVTELVSIIENIHELNPDITTNKLLEMFHVKHFTDKEDN